MIIVEYPNLPFKIKEISGKQSVWDAIRKKWLTLTPEEWVRQNFIQYLVEGLGYPSAVLSLEKSFVVDGLRRRYDIVVYKDAKPWILIECKQPDVAIDDKVLMQALRYNIKLQVPNLVITNGTHSFGWCIENQQFVELTEMPVW